MSDINKRQRVLCVGEMMADLIAYPITTVELVTDYHPLESFLIRTGGDAHNNAVDLAHLGNEVTYVGLAGNDSLADSCIRSLSEAGVDTSHIARSDRVGQSKSLILLGKDGGRTFYQNLESSAAFRFEDIDLSLLDRNDVLQIGGVFHMKSFDGEGEMRLLKKAKEKGLVTSMDVTMDRSGRWGEIISCCYPYLDYFMPSYEQAVPLTGRTDIPAQAEYLLGQGVGNVIIKAGTEGSYFRNREKAFRCGIYHVEDVADATGAGDSFVAGFLTALGRKMSPEDSMVFASACSANIIRVVGATAGIESYEQIERFVRENPRPEITYA